MLLVPGTPTPTIWVQGRALVPAKIVPAVEARDPDVLLRGFPAGSQVTITATRAMMRWSPGENGAWTQKEVRMVAWAVVDCGRDGTVRLDRARIVSGSFTRTGSAGLFWSGYPEGDPAIPKDLPGTGGDPVKASEIRIVATSGRGGSAVGGIAFRNPGDVQTVMIATPTLNGCFAYPRGARRTRALISLHGSEGGSVQSAQTRAVLFASRGIPTLALNYFAWPHERVPNLSNANLNTPIELLETARAWLSRRPEVDAKRIGLHGVSKGAEFALVAASTFPWVKAVVAVVPSDAVWEGYPTPARQGRESSWSYRGKPLPYIPLFDPEPGKYRVNTDRYEGSRAARPTESAAATIPIERTRAGILLLAGDRDEVWASGEMSRRLVARMRRFGRGARIAAEIYPRAGHQISGPGLFPVRLYGVQSPDLRDKSLIAEGEATVDAWSRTVRFLKRNL